VKGYDVYLGGGCLRDTYVGIGFKDIDIFLIPNGEEKQLVPYTPKGYAISYTKSCEDSEDMKARGVGALVGMYYRKRPDNTEDTKKFQVSVSDLMLKPEDVPQWRAEVQYIIYDHYMHQYELAEDMDIGINQIMWKHGEGYCIASRYFTLDHGAEVIQFYHTYNPKRMYSRLKRMRDKFEDYYYDEDECNLSEEDKIDLYHNGELEYEGSA
ncbi:MAG: hypothetical protein GY928_39545, partial [Colwellia sp.]|nr:hypothetical protein [Colwellia sp.]